MGTRGRVWRVGKWVGVVASVLLVAAWILSIRFWVWYVRQDGTSFELSSGYLEVHQVSGQKSQLAALLTKRAAGGPDVPGWHWRLADTAGPAPEFLYWGVLPPNISTGSFSPPNANLHWRDITIPVWFVLLFVVPATALMWRRDRQRRKRAGHCGRCGYDLTKNESGVCPECGVDNVAPEGA